MFGPGGGVLLSAQAQEPAKPDPFFQSDYVKQPLASPAGDLLKREEPAAQPKTSAKGAAGAAARGRKGASKAGAAASQRSRDILSSGPKVKAIGAIINGQDLPHFSQAAEALWKFTRERNLDVGVLCVVADPRRMKEILNSIEVRRLLGRGAYFNLRISVPPKYKVTRSPAWILTTDEGEVVLEAVASPERFINIRNEFVEPQVPLPAQEAAPPQESVQMPVPMPETAQPQEGLTDMFAGEGSSSLRSVTDFGLAGDAVAGSRNSAATGPSPAPSTARPGKARSVQKGFSRAKLAPAQPGPAKSTQTRSDP